jgi:hypothetical protein
VLSASGLLASVCPFRLSRFGSLLKEIEAGKREDRESIRGFPAHGKASLF